MFRIINTIVALSLLTLPFYAQGGPLVDINISGKVTDTSNNPISGATVTLETAKLSDTTGDNGTFSIDYISQVGISRNAPQHSNGIEAALHKNNLSVYVSKQSLVTLATYSLQGRVISRIQKNLNTGVHHIAVHSAETNIYLYKVTSGTTEILLKGISMGTFQQGTLLVDQSIVSTSTLKKKWLSQMPSVTLLRSLKMATRISQ